MNYCKNCGSFFKEPDKVTWQDDPSPRGISLPKSYYTYEDNYCPMCGADEDCFEPFELYEAIEVSEGDDDMTAVVSFGGKSFIFHLSEDGELTCSEAEEISLRKAV